MRVGLFLGSLDLGGIERVNVDLATGLLGKDFDVDMILVRPDAAPSLLPPDRARVIRLRPARNGTGTWRDRGVLCPLMAAARTATNRFRPLGLVLQVMRLTSDSLRFRRYLRKCPPDAVIASGLYQVLISLLVKRLFRRDLKLVVRLDGVHSRRYETYSRPKKLHARLVFGMIGLADHVVGVSDEIVDDARALASKPLAGCSTVLNGLDADRIRRMALQPVRHEWILHRTAPIVLAVGRLEPVKDYPCLIRAFEDLRQTTDARLVVLGDGSQRESLDHLVRSSPYQTDIDLRGSDPNPYRWMKACDVYVLSSRAEGSPVVLAESMICGTPAVSTDSGAGTRFLLGDGAHGHLVPSGDHAALARAILRTLRRPAEPGQLARGASLLSLANFAESYAGIVREVTGCATP